MSKNEIYILLQEVVNSTVIERDEIITLTENTDLIGELKLDSMEVVTIIVKAELKFGIEINEEDLNDTLVNPISNLVNYIDKKITLKK